ncbi:plasma membrane ascorbate-dependent reductase CYBRD1 isoform X2 [Frankliniella occidentalis]|uniref:Plasma membrane ascorbate-dependent reductase CYBRD1 isoform X2 n=1 Tax=Frankliniella occidentalis TaxID=133901 RepID=A0A6J1RXW9_FRAOC|nr:plasma membrane ascorbate-dependent reductase CYBRD1 isoform X2 [Frankliniella occidentalis]
MAADPSASPERWTDTSRSLHRSSSSAAREAREQARQQAKQAQAMAAQQQQAQLAYQAQQTLQAHQARGPRLPTRAPRPARPNRHRNYDDENSWACGNWFEFLLVVALAIILLVGALVLVLFWVLYYRQGFAWTENPTLEFNLHPVLMIAGFITFSGFSMLLYRIGRCCRRIYVKLFHTIFHALAVPCVVVGFIAVLDSHNLANPPIRNFYSLHSWMGFVTMGLFALQFVVGFFSFLILLCCENATAGFRASLVPIHATFGILTFMLAVATCLTGLTEKAFLTPGFKYVEWPEEAFIINALAMVLVGLAILLVYAVRRETFRVRVASIVSQRL